ncbi:MAG TPA: lysophospholipase [Candidatus Brocadiia bacterium]|nr:lysophospholipase [Candidatus Brocadiia bacterium]
MSHTDWHWTLENAQKLYGQAWLPEPSSGKPKAAVCLVHGMGEHSGRYAHVGKALNMAEYALLTFDLRGNGKSEGRHGYIPSFEAWMSDVDRLLARADELYPGIPRFLYGHSMGSMIVLGYALKRRPKITGAIVTGAAFRSSIEPSKALLAFARLMNNIWPTFTIANDLDIGGISRDPEVVKAAEADPLSHDRVSVRLGNVLLDTRKWVWEHAEDFPLPLLMMHGSADPLCLEDPAREFSTRVPGDCAFKSFPGLYHEVHNEPEKQEVFAFLIEWLNSHLPH